MIRVRTFLNTDPPHLAEIWRAQPPQRGLVQPMSVRILEEHIFAKPYFDRFGLNAAMDEGRVVGFAHAEFGASDDLSTLSTEMGAVGMLLASPEYPFDAIAEPLINASEEYLRSRGATLLYAGGIFPLNGFYLGLYGGSELPGILQSDARLVEFYQSHGYQEIDRVGVLQLSLPGFRPIVDRHQMQVRRGYRIEAVLDPPARSWWEACTLGHADRTRFHLYPRGGNEPAASVTYWHIEPLASRWGVHAVGVLDLEVAPAARRQGLATFLLGESLRQLQSHGVTLVEAQTMAANEAALGLYRRLGFQAVDQGIVLRKTGASA